MANKLIIINFFIFLIIKRFSCLPVENQDKLYCTSHSDCTVFNEQAKCFEEYGIDDYKLCETDNCSGICRGSTQDEEDPETDLENLAKENDPTTELEADEMKEDEKDPDEDLKEQEKKDDPTTELKKEELNDDQSDPDEDLKAQEKKDDPTTELKEEELNDDQSDPDEDLKAQEKKDDPTTELKEEELNEDQSDPDEELKKQEKANDPVNEIDESNANDDDLDDKLDQEDLDFQASSCNTTYECERRNNGTKPFCFQQFCVANFPERCENEDDWNCPQQFRCNNNKKCERVTMVMRL